MAHHWNKLSKYSAIGMCCSLAVWISSAGAKEKSPTPVNESEAIVDELPELPPPARPTVRSSDATTPTVAPTIPSAKPQATNGAAERQLVPGGAVKRPFLRPAVPRNPARGKLTAAEAPLPQPTAQGKEHAPPAPLSEEETVLPREEMPLLREDAPATTSDDIRILPTPPIVYDTDLHARMLYRSGKIDLVMLTQDPTSGCYYEIPLCIPACCEGEPSVAGGRGIFGRGVVEYRWACGFRAIVRFRHVLGDVRVDYEGD